MIGTANIIFQNKEETRSQTTKKNERSANAYIADIRQMNDFITQILK
jgi:hypothetical protein